MTTRRPKYDEAINATRVSRSFRPTGIDCPFCGKKEIYVTHKGDFALGWFLQFTVKYLIYHFVVKPLLQGGRCSNCGTKLPKAMR